MSTQKEGGAFYTNLRHQLIDEVDGLRALLATKNETIRSLESKLIAKDKAMETLKAMVSEARECNHLWRQMFRDFSKPVLKCECCGEEMPR